MIANRVRLWTFFPLLILIFSSTSSFALTPLKGLLLGEAENSSLAKDPLPFLMTEGESKFSQKSEAQLYRDQLARYRGFYEEGENLERSCKTLGEVRYPTAFDRQQAKRAVLASLQYYAIDKLVTALAQNASERALDNVTYTTFVDSMIGSYCSKNMTIISHRELKRQFMDRFERFKGNSETQNAADLSRNPLFASALSEAANKEMIKDRELFVWSELFKSVCSWSGDIFDLRLMVPLARDPVIMSHVFRSMAKLDLRVNQARNEISRVQAQNTPRIACKNLICRRVRSDKEFVETFPKSIGSSGLLTDLQRLYCQDLRDVDYVRNNPVPQIKAILDKRTLDEEALLKAGLITLWTGIPDLMLYAENFVDVQKVVDYSFKREVGRWADEQIAFGLADLTYEEPISYEVETRELFWNPNMQTPKVEIDVNLGEFDRMNQSIGKLTLDVPLDLSESFLSWLQFEWKGSVQLGAAAREQLVKRLAIEIENELKEAGQAFKLDLWPPQIAQLAADEIITQLGIMDINPFKRSSLKKIEIPMRLNFGIFALKALRDRFLIEKSIKEGDLLREELALALRNEQENQVQSEESIDEAQSP